MKIAKWGNSLAVRLPKSEIDKLGLKVGDEVDVSVTRLEDSEAAVRTGWIRWLEEMGQKYQGRLPADFKFNRAEANRRGY